jgi:predicted alpha/beta superfamily hydrolase
VHLPKQVVVCVAYACITSAVCAVEPVPDRVEVLSITPVGEVQEVALRSRILEEERRLRVRLPRDYDSGTERYPLLVLLDAEWHFNLAAADVELLSECSYASPHPLPRMIVVGVVNVDRNRDFTPTRSPKFRNMRFPTSGGADLFRRFLVEELLPTIEATYRTKPYSILAGWSLGGLFTIDTLLSKTPAFDSYLAISPSLWWDDERTLRRLSESPESFSSLDGFQLTVTLGTEESGSLVERSTRAFLEHLTDHPLRGLRVEEVSVDGLGHNYSPKMAFFLGLATSFSDWRLPAEFLDRDLAAIDAYYASLSKRYHFEIPVPEDVYGTLGWKLFEAGRRDEASDLFRAWVARHPGSSVAVASLGSFHREIGDSAQAVVLLRKAMEIEAESPQPRDTFLLDLQRDVENLSRDD